MKDCKKIHPLLPLYVENQLSAREKAAVEKHISACPEARQELKQLERLGKALKTMPEPKMPHDLHAKIMARVHGKSIPATTNPIWLRTSWGLAAAASLGFIFFIQNFGWFEYKNIPTTLKPNTPTETGVSMTTASTHRALKPTHPQAVPIAQLEVAKNLDVRLSLKNVETNKEAGIDYALKPTTPAPAAADSMVQAMAPAPRAKKKAMAYNSNTIAGAAGSSNGAQVREELGLEYDLQNDLQKKSKLAFNAGGNDNGRTETEPWLNYAAPLPDISAQPGDKQIPKFLRFDILETGLSKYQINWQTDLITKGQIYVLDAAGNTLQAVTEQGQYAYDHQLVIDSSKIDHDFFIKVLVSYLNGNQAVTISNTLKQPQ